MQQALTYKTSYTKDSYSIFSDNIQIGKLYKKEWLGSNIETTINGNRFKFDSTWFFNPTIFVFNKNTKQKIGTVTVNNFFKISPSATFISADNKQYKWTTKGIFSYDWEWFDAVSNRVVAMSAEPFDLFKQTGTINLTQQNQQNELLIALGIHLRNVVKRKTAITQISGLVIFSLTFLKLFA